MSNLDRKDAHAARKLDVCGKCQGPLPLRFARHGETEAHWLCATCGTRYCAVFDRDSHSDARQNILLASLRFDRSRLAPPPNVTAAFIAERVNQDYRGRKQRVHKRRPIAAPVAALPLDHQFLPTGAPFMGMAHNISTGGIALIHTRSTSAPYLALELTLSKDHEIRAVIQVVRCQAFGLFYEIAGRFLVRIAAAPTSA